MNRFYQTGMFFFLGLLGACAQPSQQTTDTPAQIPAEVTPTPLPSLEACDCKDKSSLALLVPLSGPYKDIGAQTLEGAMMGFYEQYSPSDVEMRIFDTQSTPAGARAAAQNAALDGADILIGPIFSAHVDEAAAVAAANDIPMLALSNDKHLARENVTVLGAHLETEAYALIQLAVENNGQNILLIAPNTAYGKRLSQEMNRVSEDWPSIALDPVLFADPSVDGLTRFIRETTDFGERSENLKSVLNTFKANWEREQNASLALTKTVNDLELGERWAELYPATCLEVPDPDAPLSDAPQDAALPVPSEPVADAPSSQLTMDLPVDEPVRIGAYKHTRVCEPPVVDEELAIGGQTAVMDAGEHADADAPKPMTEAELNAILSMEPEGTEEPPLPAVEPDTSMLALDTDGIEDAIGGEAIAAVQTNEMASEPPLSYGKPSAVFEDRYEMAVENDRLGILNEVAQCFAVLSEKEFEPQRGVDTILRSFARREVLGPPKYDTIILPLSGDQLRLAASLFDYYHVGRPDVTFLGTSLWDKTSDLGNEPSLQGGQWLSISRPFSPDGSRRYKALYKKEPGYLSALAYDAVRVAFEKTRTANPVKMAPANGAFRIGESGVFRVNPDGTTDRKVTIKTLGDPRKVDNRTPFDPEYLGFDPAHLTDKDRRERRQYLERVCLGR